MHNKKILYLKSGPRGAGVCSYVQQVIHMAKVCKDQNIPMYIDFRENMIFHKSDTKNDNTWEYFFEQPFRDLNLNDYEKEEAVWYHHDDPRALRFEFRFTPDSEYLKIARKLCNEFVLFKPDIVLAANDFIKNNTNQNYLTVHKRGCDHNNTQSFDITKYLFETDKYIDNYEQIFVCSDEEYSISKFKQRYGKKVICYNTVRETDPNQSHIGIHLKENKNNNIYINSRDCLIEVLIMSRAKFLLKTVSNVTHTAVMCNSNLNFVWIDANYPTCY